MLEAVLMIWSLAVVLVCLEMSVSIWWMLVGGEVEEWRRWWAGK